MGFLMFCGICCMLLSIWAIIQLTLMGIFYKIESVVMIEDVEPHHGEYTDYDDFIKKTKENYSSTAINCWIAAGIYLAFLIISLFCIRRAKTVERLQNEKLLDDELTCNPQPTQKELEKEKKKSPSASPPASPPPASPPPASPPPASPPPASPPKTKKE